MRVCMYSYGLEFIFMAIEITGWKLGLIVDFIVAQLGQWPNRMVDLTKIMRQEHRHEQLEGKPRARRGCK